MSGYAERLWQQRSLACSANPVGDDLSGAPFYDHVGKILTPQSAQLIPASVTRRLLNRVSLKMSRSEYPYRGLELP
jgi:hypothetical protein